MISASKSIWNREYSEVQIIPSSTREAPSQALMLFSELLGFREMNRALEAGCGNGRNSIYLAGLGMDVEAMDFSPVAIGEVKKRAKKLGLSNKIRLHESNLENPLPFDAESFDLCLDFYVFCHFLDDNVKKHYVNELWRVLRPGGYAISALFSPQDEYYNLLANHNEEPNIVEDPENNIVKVLYNKDEFRRCFSPPFRIKYFTEFEFDDVVEGRPYHRDILVMALQKS